MAKGFIFIPRVGLRTRDCYLHGANYNDNLCHSGVIEHVGIDYFILRDEVLMQPLMVQKGSYWVIEEEDFE